jgi:hypothetical protein
LALRLCPINKWKLQLTRLIVAFKGAKMRQKSGPVKEPAMQVFKTMRRATRRTLLG